MEGSRTNWWLVSALSVVIGIPALGFALLARSRWMLTAWGVGIAVAVALAVLPWHPRKAFLDDFQTLAPGTPIASARARMEKYVENGEVPVDPKLDVPVAASVPPLNGSITYRWNTVDPRYNADLGVVEYANGRVTKAMFLPD